MPATESKPVGRRVLRIVALALVVVLVLGVWLGQRFGWVTPVKQERVLLVYCFSTLDGAMKEALIPRFRERWQQERGETVEVVATFPGSGEIIRRILDRYPAEVAIVTSEIDAMRLPVGWLSWRRLPHGGVLARTPLVIAVRDGNPHDIRGFGDLGQEGVDLLHGDPATSGAAELAIVAAYECERRRSGDRDEAARRLLGIWRNVTLRPASAREVRRRFVAGEGDAFVTYEQDLLETPSGPRLEGAIVVPQPTILAEPVVVRIGRNVDERQAELVDAFLDFLWTREAQQILVDYGFRSVLDELDASRGDFAPVEGAFTLDDVGGVTARREILDRVWRDRIVPALAESSGLPTARGPSRPFAPAE